MKHPRRFLVAMLFSVGACLCFVAGQERFGLLGPEGAKFAGIALTMMAGVSWAYFGFAQGAE